MDHKGLAQTRSRSKLDPATPDGQFHGQGLTKFDQPIGFPVSKLTRLRVAEFGGHGNARGDQQALPSLTRPTAPLSRPLASRGLALLAGPGVVRQPPSQSWFSLVASTEQSGSSVPALSLTNDLNSTS